MSSDDFSLERSFAYPAYRLARALRKDFFRIARSLGIDIYPEQWFMLNMLRERDGQSQKELAARVFEDKPSVSRTLKSLEANGYVRSTANPRDGRSLVYSLTPKGERTYQTFVARMSVERQRVARGLDEADYEAYRRVVDRLIDNLD